MKRVLALGGEKGLTLIELLVAAIVLSIGVLGLAPLMAISVRGSVRGENVTNVVAAAQHMIESKIGAVGFAVIPYVQKDTFDSGKYTTVTTVTDKTVNSSIPAHVYRVDVDVVWTDDGGMQRNITFTTYTTKK